MKQLTTYQCSICGSAYYDEESCKTCESFHQQPLVIERIIFGSYQKSPVPYPERVQFRMSDGSLIQYVCERIIQPPETNLPIENEVNEQ